MSTAKCLCARSLDWSTTSMRAGRRSLSDRHQGFARHSREFLPHCGQSVIQVLQRSLGKNHREGEAAEGGRGEEGGPVAARGSDLESLCSVMRLTSFLRGPSRRAKLEFGTSSRSTGCESAVHAMRASSMRRIIIIIINNCYTSLGCRPSSFSLSLSLSLCRLLTLFWQGLLRKARKVLAAKPDNLEQEGGHMETGRTTTLRVRTKQGQGVLEGPEVQA